MSDHYYTQNPGSAHRPSELTVRALGLVLTFDTDAGVFSKDGLDYGSRLLVESLPVLSGRLLDLGCGWGAVGVLLAKKYPSAQLVLSDVNERAVLLARKNIERNRAQNAMAVRSEGFDALQGLFDAVITNPPIRAGKQVIYGLFEAAKERLSPGGALYVVIRKQHGAPSALKCLEDVYGKAEVIERDKGFWVIKAQSLEKGERT